MIYENTIFYCFIKKKLNIINTIHRLKVEKTHIFKNNFIVVGN